MVQLIFTSGDAPSLSNLKAALSFLLKSSNSTKSDLSNFDFKKSDFFVIAADSGAQAAFDAGFTPNLIVGDMDSISKELLENFKALKIQTDIYPTNKDDSDTVLALKSSSKNSRCKTILIGGGGGREDHLFALLKEMESDYAPDYWITANSIIYNLKTKGAFKIALPLASTLSIFFTANKTKIKTTGLKWELTSRLCRKINYSLSNLTQTENVSIKILAGKAIVAIGLESIGKTT